MTRPGSLVLGKDILLLGIPALLFAHIINTHVHDVWTRLGINAAVAGIVVSSFPDVIVRHLVDRTFAGTVAITIFLSAQQWSS